MHPARNELTLVFKPFNPNVSAVNVTGELNINRRSVIRERCHEDDFCATTTGSDKVKETDTGSSAGTTATVSIADAAQGTRARSNTENSGAVVSDGDSSSASSVCSFEVDDLSIGGLVDVDGVLGTNDSKDEIGSLVKEALIDFASFS